MAVVHRRVYYGKAGKGGPLIDLLISGHETMKAHGMNFKTRVLSDHLSGRTDRIVEEMEAETMAALTDAMNGAMADPAAQKELGDMFAKLEEMIHYAEAETWNVH